MTSKTFLRRQLRQNLKDIPHKQQRDQILAEQIVFLANHLKIGQICGYFPIHHEPKIDFDALEWPLFLPKVDGSDSMHFVRSSLKDCIISNGIPEPLSSGPLWDHDLSTLMVVPGVTFQEGGYRLGLGGGYYDRALRGCGHLTNLTVVGIGYVEQLTCWTVESFDYPMDMVFLVDEDHQIMTLARH